MVNSVYVHRSVIEDMSVEWDDITGSCSDPECCGGPFETLNIRCGCGVVREAQDYQVSLAEVVEMWEDHIKEAPSE